MTLDVNKINGLLTIILLSSLSSLVLTLAALWFLSKWLEIKESVKNLLEKIDNKIETSPQSQKLKVLYSDTNTNIQEVTDTTPTSIIPAKTSLIETSVMQTVDNKPSYAEVLFSDEENQSVFSSTTDNAKDAVVEKTAKLNKKAVTTDDIKEILKTRKSKQK